MHGVNLNKCYNLLPCNSVRRTDFKTIMHAVTKDWDSSTSLRPLEMKKFFSLKKTDELEALYEDQTGYQLPWEEDAKHANTGSCIR